MSFNFSFTYEIPRVVKFLETNNVTVVRGGVGEGKWRVNNGFSACLQSKNSGEGWWTDSCATVNYTPKKREINCKKNWYQEEAKK